LGEDDEVFGEGMMKLGEDDAPTIVIPDGDPEPILPGMALWGFGEDDGRVREFNHVENFIFSYHNLAPVCYRS
jgi:hypothetical protein